MNEQERAGADRLAAEYDALHDELKRLLASPVRDMPAVAAVMDRLESTYQAFREAHGLHGNNPNE